MCNLGIRNAPSSTVAPLSPSFLAIFCKSRTESVSEFQPESFPRLARRLLWSASRCWLLHRVLLSQAGLSKPGFCRILTKNGRQKKVVQYSQFLNLKTLDASYMIGREKKGSRPKFHEIPIFRPFGPSSCTRRNRRPECENRSPKPLKIYCDVLLPAVYSGQGCVGVWGFRDSLPVLGASLSALVSAFSGNQRSRGVEEVHRSPSLELGRNWSACHSGFAKTSTETRA